MSDLRNGPCRIINIFPHVNRFHVACKWPSHAVETKDQEPMSAYLELTGWHNNFLKLTPDMWPAPTCT